ncbi:TPA: hypothetical protein N0F65_009419 [Lagenidium giganteum]|uniref:Uncharacterized protein n=1 Tax=Lagenidium giganteum TaxID=4803 RepID=A0AAV2ZBE8_9STRA|nr:TPA: hypothetical protein N0F65_009419 [Lagenidium giganteum]
MSSCVMPIAPVSPRRLHKRPRSDSRDSLSISRILKVCKRPMESSPASEVAAASEAEQRASLWPQVQGCPTVRYALTFLQNSRQHAVQLLMKNHFQRAVGVLEKIEKATEMVSRQRRQTVLEQVNQACAFVDTPASGIKPRRVCFSDVVAIHVADDFDRSSTEISPLVREEILILRASRTIPHQNLSEFWQ